MPAAPRARPDPRFEECADCGHFPSWHEGSRRPLPWLGLACCQAWSPDSIDWKCRCRGRRSKKPFVPARAPAEEVLA